jgi:ubiquinone/menaquinone biosynthesis C-methylase UbiE
MTNTTHFDRRAADYDADELHRRILEILVGRAEIKPGFRVLDVATGTVL